VRVNERTSHEHRGPARLLFAQATPVNHLCVCFACCLVDALCCARAKIFIRRALELAHRDAGSAADGDDGPSTSPAGTASASPAETASAARAAAVVGTVGSAAAAAAALAVALEQCRDQGGVASARATAFGALGAWREANPTVRR